MTSKFITALLAGSALTAIAGSAALAQAPDITDRYVDWDREITAHLESARSSNDCERVEAHLDEAEVLISRTQLSLGSEQAMMDEGTHDGAIDRGTLAMFMDRAYQSQRELERLRETRCTSETGHALMLLAGGFDPDLDGAGIGFQREYGAVGGERHALRTRESVFHTAIFLQLVLNQLPLQFGAGHSSQDNAAMTEFENGAMVESGFVYGALSPSGSSGINLGTLGSYFTAQSEVETWRAEIKYDLNAFSGETFDTYVSLGYQRTDIGFDAMGSHEGNGIVIEQSRSQQVVNDTFSAQIGTSFHSDPVRFAGSQFALGTVVFHGFGSLGAFHTSAEFDSLEVNLCNVCPAADRDFRIALQDEESYWSAGGSAGFGAAFPLSDNAALKFTAGAQYLGRIGNIYNPPSGDDVFFDGRTSGLTDERPVQTYLMTGLRLSF